MGCNSSSAASAPRKQRKNQTPAILSILNDELISFDDISQVLSVSPPVTLNRDDFGEFTFVQCGGAGKVYLSPRLSDGKQFAMKFFGYTSKKPKSGEIEKEINLMQSLTGIPNVVQIEGIFPSDSVEGYVPNRIYEDTYPVIVMEALLGGDLFERLQTPGDHMTERFLASAFRGVVEALKQIHSRGFIHRDLKLENLIYESKDPNSAIKVVDFGMMKKIKGPNGIFISLHVEGTAGYCAPESYLKRQYSTQSDVWQAGCCLYSMLSGNSAFPQDNPDRVVTAEYAPMVGVEWDKISSIAKDLIQRILVKDPNKRCTLEEILNHPWLQPGQAPDVQLDAGYRTRIYKLALRQKMKNLFQDEGLQHMCKVRREMLITTLPFLKNQTSNFTIPSPSPSQSNILTRDESKRSASSSSSGNNENSMKHKPFRIPSSSLPLPGVTSGRSSSSGGGSGGPGGVPGGPGVGAGGPQSTSSSSSQPPPPDKYIQQKLKYLKSGLFYAPSTLVPSAPSHSNPIDNIPVRRTSSYTYPSPPKEDQQLTNILRRTSDSTIILTPDHPSSWKHINLSQITFQDFVIIMNKVDLPQLATLPVFHIFEKGNSGVMDMKEFLLTILTIYPQRMKSIQNSQPENGDGIHPAKLFFDFFDIKETGEFKFEILNLNF